MHVQRYPAGLFLERATGEVDSLFRHRVWCVHSDVVRFQQEFSSRGLASLDPSPVFLIHVDGKERTFPLAHIDSSCL